MCKKTLLLTAALVSSFGAVAQALPDGTTSLLPAGVTANIGQEKMFVKQKNLCVAGSPSKGYKAYFSATDADHGEELWVRRYSHRHPYGKRHQSRCRNLRHPVADQIQ